MRVTVGTLARGREDRLANLMRSLEGQDFDELIIACMQDAPYADLPSVGYRVRQVVVDGERLPLARARNAVAAQARGDALIYLDVDCIADPELVSAYARSAALRGGGCAMGEVRYLDGSSSPSDAAFADLWARAAMHPARAFGDEPREMSGHGDFWSLSFAVSKGMFNASGGFDERFEGYGGEDTDFAASLSRAGIALHWVPQARAVHQWHAVSIPPLQHLDDIVRNANLFEAKHGRTCMEYWVDQMIDSGHLVREEGLRIARRPSADELEAALRGPDVRYS